jgi:hypothetical protein
MMKKREIAGLLIMVGSLNACQSGSQQAKIETDSTQAAAQKTFTAGTFGYDLDFLRGRDSVIVLKNRSGQGQVIVSAKYQAKVFTSTAEGPEGRSFGWVNYKAFDAAKDLHMNAYGGENRLWLGPEGNRFSLYFKPGTSMEFANWATPPAIDTEAWTLISTSGQQAILQKETELVNYAGTRLKIRLNREIGILENVDIERILGLKLESGVKSVGFRTDNALTNAGDQAWTRASGAPCLWMLDMFNVSPSTVVALPYQAGKSAAKIATTDYFGEIPKDRIRYENSTLLFKADGQNRGKLGLAPERAKPIAGSYDAQNNVLTIATFEVDAKGTYLNQEWNTKKDPYRGDAVNAYNDGPLADGSQMGPFYEIESVSPAAFLKPDATLTHQHNVFHFTGEKKGLNAISEQVLGISLEAMEKAFQ